MKLKYNKSVKFINIMLDKLTETRIRLIVFVKTDLRLSY